MKDGEPFAIASLWSSPKMIDGSSAHTCALVTTDSNNYLQQIHNRMPVILSPEDINVWLDPKATERELKTIIKCYPDELMNAYQVSNLVNSPANNLANCIIPV